MKTLLAFMLLTLLLAATPSPAATGAAGRVARALATHLGIAHSNKERLPDDHKESRLEYGKPNAETNNKERINREHQSRQLRLALELYGRPNANASIMERGERRLFEIERRLEYAE